MCLDHGDGVPDVLQDDNQLQLDFGLRTELGHQRIQNHFLVISIKLHYLDPVFTRLFVSYLL